MALYEGKVNKGKRKMMRRQRKQGVGKERWKTGNWYLYNFLIRATEQRAILTYERF